MIVQIKDMDGAASGLSTTGTALIALGDINDNPPTFSKPSVSGFLLTSRSKFLNMPHVAAMSESNERLSNYE